MYALWNSKTYSKGQCEMRGMLKPLDYLNRD